jgi:hypothetical protein
MRKYYRLTKDLPTFKKGELFYINEYGCLASTKNHVVAYMNSTIAKFPNILKDWFEEVPAPIRDEKTKTAFGAYMKLHPDERFFQAVRNFTREYLDKTTNFIAASDNIVAGSFVDTFHWECDEMLKEDDEAQS